jgi:hypothetical protein
MLARLGAVCSAPSPALLALCLSLLAATACGVEYEHRLLWGGLIQQGGGALSDNGDYYLIKGNDGVHSFIMRLNDEFLPEFVEGVRPIPSDVNDSGDWIGWGHVGDGSMSRVIKNGRVLWTDWVPGVWLGGGGRLTADGTAFWLLNHQEVAYQVVMREEESYSDQWSTGTTDFLRGVLPDGRVLWAGRPRGGGDIELWLDGTSLTDKYYVEGYGRPGNDGRINQAGHLAWAGKRDVSPHIQHVFVDEFDVTAHALGPEGRSIGDFVLNTHSQVVWLGVPEGGFLPRIFVGDQLLYADLVDENDRVELLGFSDRADVLWGLNEDGVGFIRDIFVNDLSLPRAVYGSNFDEVSAMEMNQCGQVLWAAQSNGLWDFWLSTPIPEPSVLLLGLPLVLLLRQHRRRGP